MTKLATLDYISMGVYLVLMIGVSILSGFFIKDIKDYFKGGNSIPWGLSGISNFMGSISTMVFIAYAGIAYNEGIISVVVLWSAVLPFLFAALIIGKRWLRSRIISPVEYLETRFNANIRQLFGWTGLGMRFLDNMVRLYAIGIFITAATDVSFLQAIVLSSIIITIFTIFGGVWSVVIMDTLQFVILIFSAILLSFLSLEASGGVNVLIEKLPEHFQISSGPKGQSFWLIAYYLMVFFKYNGNWAFIQRFYSVKDEESTRKLGLLSAFLVSFLPILIFIPAISAADLIPNLDDPEEAYVAAAVLLLPAGLLGLMIMAMFSATMSTLNSEYNVMSSVITNDIYKQLIRRESSDRHLVFVARLNVLLIGFIVMIGSLFIGRLGGAFEANKILSSLFAIPIAIPLVLGLLFKRTNSSGAFFSVVLGLISGLVLNILVDIEWEIATIVQILICLIVFFVSGYVLKGGNEERKRTVEFFIKLNDPLKREEISEPDKQFSFFLYNLISAALIASGVLFLIMSLFTIAEFSGRIATLLSLSSIAIGFILKWITTGTLAFYSKKTKY